MENIKKEKLFLLLIFIGPLFLSIQANENNHTNNNIKTNDIDNELKINNEDNTINTNNINTVEKSEDNILENYKSNSENTEDINNANGLKSDENTENPINSKDTNNTKKEDTNVNRKVNNTSNATDNSSSSLQYCDFDLKCDDCQLCGVDTKDYCSCSFENYFCNPNDGKNYKYYDNDLIHYDGCIKSNDGNEEICGSSNINFQDGKSQIKINSKDAVSKDNILCFHSFNTDPKDFTFSVKLEGEGQLKTDIFLFVTYQDNTNQIERIVVDGSKEKNTEKKIAGLKKASIYSYLSKADNLQKQSLVMNIEEVKVESSTTSVDIVKKKKK